MVKSGYAMKKVDENTEVCAFDGVSRTTVYTGGITDLKRALVLWRRVEIPEMGGDALPVLTLGEIAEQLGNQLITVIVDSPFSGKIYQYGNYSDGKWWEIGSTGGYA